MYCFTYSLYTIPVFIGKTKGKKKKNFNCFRYFECCKIWYISCIGKLYTSNNELLYVMEYSMYFCTGFKVFFMCAYGEAPLLYELARRKEVTPIIVV